MEIRESVYVIRYFACHIAGCGILDKKILGEALSRVEGLHKGIPHYLPKKNPRVKIYSYEKKKYGRAKIYHTVVR